MKIAIQSLAMILVVAGSWLIANEFLFSNQKSERNRLNTQIEAQSCALKQLSTAVEYGLITEELNQIYDRVPQELRMEQVIALIKKLARVSDLKVTSIKTLKPKSEKYWSEVPVVVKLNGEFPQLAFFMKRLSKETRLMSVGGISFAQPEAEVTLQVYWSDWQPEEPNVTLGHQLACQDYGVPENLNRLLKIPDRKIDVAQLVHNPMVFERPAEDLVKYHLAGVARANDHWLALLEDQKGHGVTLTVGSRMENGFRVTKIARNFVMLSRGKVSQKIGWSQL